MSGVCYFCGWFWGEMSLLSEPEGTSTTGVFVLSPDSLRIAIANTGPSSAGEIGRVHQVSWVVICWWA